MSPGVAGGGHPGDEDEQILPHLTVPQRGDTRNHRGVSLSVIPLYGPLGFCMGIRPRHFQNCLARLSEGPENPLMRDELGITGYEAYF